MKPINLIMLLIGGSFFVITQSFWIVPLTILTYALLVLLASRDPIFVRKALGEDAASKGEPDNTSNLSPERRARWLPRGETRRTVEESLVAYRKLVASIEGSGEVARSVLDDTIPRLHAAAERLVELAQEREKIADAIREIKSQDNGDPGKERLSILRDLEEKTKAADEEISGTHDRLLNLRARVIGASLNSEVENRTAAVELNRSLDELNYRLEALGEISSSIGDTPSENNDV